MARKVRRLRSEQAQEPGPTLTAAADPTNPLLSSSPVVLLVPLNHGHSLLARILQTSPVLGVTLLGGDAWHAVVHMLICMPSPSPNALSPPQNMYIQDGAPPPSGGPKRLRTGPGDFDGGGGGGGGPYGGGGGGGRGGERGPPRSMHDNPPCSTLFIGNLGPGVTEAELRRVFSVQPVRRGLSVILGPGLLQAVESRAQHRDVAMDARSRTPHLTGAAPATGVRRGISLPPERAHPASSSTCKQAGALLAALRRCNANVGMYRGTVPFRKTPARGCNWPPPPPTFSAPARRATSSCGSPSTSGASPALSSLIRWRTLSSPTRSCRARWGGPQPAACSRPARSARSLGAGATAANSPPPLVSGSGALLPHRMRVSC
jgi:hypothetical protein